MVLDVAVEAHATCGVIILPPDVQQVRATSANLNVRLAIRARLALICADTLVVLQPGMLSWTLIAYVVPDTELRPIAVVVHLDEQISRDLHEITCLIAEI